MPLSLREHANAIADGLYADLKAGTIEAIGIDQITPRCLAIAVQEGRSNADMERMIELTTRRVVEKAGESLL